MNDPAGERYAVIGVSENQEKYGYKVFRYLVDQGYTVFPVHLDAGTIDGHKRYAYLKDIPETPTFVVTVVPPKVTEDIVRQCHALGIKKVWMQPGSESDAAIQYSKGNGMQVTANACIMLT